MVTTNHSRASTVSQLLNKHLLRHHELQPRCSSKAAVVSAVVIRPSCSIAAEEAVGMQLVAAPELIEQAQHACCRLAVAVPCSGEVDGERQLQLLCEAVDFGHGGCAAAGEGVGLGEAAWEGSEKGKAVVEVRGGTPWLENMTSVWPVACRRRRVGGTRGLKKIQSRSLEGKVLPAVVWVIASDFVVEIAPDFVFMIVPSMSNAASFVQGAAGAGP